jgi:hypothetical protein
MVLDCENGIGNEHEIHVVAVADCLSKGLDFAYYRAVSNVMSQLVEAEVTHR